ncbi:MAG: ECF-type sigma factor, partial [Acidobacteriota bacterium]
TLDDEVLGSSPSIDLFALDEAIRQLEQQDLRAGRVVELKFFAGLTHQEIASVLEVSEATVKREWRMARAWLQNQLRPTASSGL